MASILVVEDERNVRRGIVAALEDRHDVAEAATSQEALARARDVEPEVVLLDLMLGPEDGLALLADLRAQARDLPVIVLTAHGSVSSCVKAMKAGAFDYLLKPFDVEELRIVIDRALQASKLTNEVRFLRDQARPVDLGPGVGAILGQSPRILAVRDLIRRLAPHDGAVLVTGPSGTGKELVARALHEESGRARGPFVVVNCAAIPEGLLESELFGHERGAFTGATGRRRGTFELASGGTLFLDEVGELPPRLQPKLLRVLQDGTFTRLGSEKTQRSDARVVSATNRDLAAEQKAGRFREDLFYRLETFTIELPSLLDRPGDLPLLLDHFASRVARRLGRPKPELPPEVLEVLERHAWPGNVRELEHVAERLVVLADAGVASADDLPPSLSRPETAAVGPELATSSLPRAVAAFEADLIRTALEREAGHRGRTAKALGVSLRTLQYKLARYGLGG